MYFAHDKNKNKVEATKEIRGNELYCPYCGGDVIVKAGEQKVNHFAHKKTDCGYFKYKGMSSWHKLWQNLFTSEQREVYMKKNGEKHIADAVNSNGVVIEFQNSPISTENKRSRDNFYDKLIWVVNADTFKDKISFESLRTDEYMKATEKDYENEITKEHESVKKSISKYNFLELYQKHTILQSITASWRNYRRWKLEKFEPKYYKDKFKYNWSYERSLWSESKTPVFIDLGGDNMYLFKGKNTVIRRTKKDFINKYCV